MCTLTLNNRLICFVNGKCKLVQGGNLITLDKILHRRSRQMLRNAKQKILSNNQLMVCLKLLPSVRKV